MLLSILKQTPEDLLDSEINDEILPGVTKRNLLDKLANFKYGDASKQRELLDEALAEWAMELDSEKYKDKNVREVLRFMAEILPNMFMQEPLKTETDGKRNQTQIIM